MPRHDSEIGARSGAHRGPGIRRSPFMTMLTWMPGRHGWRFFAVPVLIVATVWAVLSISATPGPKKDRADAAVVPTPATPTATPTAAQTSTGTGTSAAGTPQSGALPQAASARHRSGTHPPRTPASSTASAPAMRPAYGQLIQVSHQAGVAVCASNTSRKHVFVSIAAQHVWMCEGSRLARDTAVTTGAPASHDSTPLGSWMVQARQADRYLSGPGYSYRVDYWVPFNGDFGFHDASWQKMPFGATGYRKLGSRGCVHLPTAQMAWLYKWVKVGSPVTVRA